MALHDVSFFVNRGEIMGLIGPNGAGKTTLFDLITGFQNPDSGAVRFDGEDITRLKPHETARRGLVRTFQLVRPFRRLTVFENVAVAYQSLRAKRGETKSNFEREVHEVLELVHLAEKAESRAADLSHGDLKRLELARVFVGKPRMVLLDEPFSGLNVEEIERLSTLIRTLHKREGYTIIIVEHILRALMRLVGRIIVLSFGEVIADGPPDGVSRMQNVIEAYLGRGAA